VNVPILAEGKYSLDLMVVESNIRFHDYVEEAEVNLNADQSFEEPQRTVVRV